MSEKTGRPPIFTQELADQVCARLADGQSLRSICKDDDMPAVVTVFKWIRENEGFAKQYARAKGEAADAMAEEILDIADDGTNDWMERHGKDGSVGWELNGENIQRSRVRIDTRKWIASKLKPKKYGEKLELAGDPEAPMQVSGCITLVKPGSGS